jgi:hypothetical protein
MQTTKTHEVGSFSLLLGECSSAYDLPAIVAPEQAAAVKGAEYLWIKKTLLAC